MLLLQAVLAKLAGFGEEDISTVCAYCKKFIRGKWPVDPLKTSHGICNDCLKKHFPDVVEEVIKERSLNVT